MAVKKISTVWVRVFDRHDAPVCDAVRLSVIDHGDCFYVVGGYTRGDTDGLASGMMAVLPGSGKTVYRYIYAPSRDVRENHPYRIQPFTFPKEVTTDEPTPEATA